MIIIRSTLLLIILIICFIFTTKEGKSYLNKYIYLYPQEKVFKIINKNGIIKNIANDSILENEIPSEQIIKTTPNSSLLLELNPSTKIYIGENTQFKIELLKDSNLKNKSMSQFNLILGKIYVYKNENKLNELIRVKENIFEPINGKSYFSVSSNISFALVTEGTINQNIQNEHIKIYTNGIFLEGKNGRFIREQNSSLINIFKSPKNFDQYNFGVDSKTLNNFFIKNLNENGNSVEIFQSEKLNKVSQLISIQQDLYKSFVDDLTKTRNEYVELKDEIENNRDNLNLDILCLESKLNNCTLRCKDIYSKNGINIPNSIDEINPAIFNIKSYRNNALLKLDELQKNIEIKVARNDALLNKIELMKIKFQTLKNQPSNQQLIDEITEISDKK